MSATEDVLAVIGMYRSSAIEMRQATDRPLGVRLAGLIDLMRAAEHEPDQFIRDQAEKTVYVQALPLLDESSEAPSGDAIERAARALRSKGLVSCPTCVRPLHAEPDFVRWALLLRRERERIEALDREAS